MTKAMHEALMTPPGYAVFGSSRMVYKSEVAARMHVATQRWSFEDNAFTALPAGTFDVMQAPTGEWVVIVRVG